jgi:hypothetical protein
MPGIVDSIHEDAADRSLANHVGVDCRRRCADDIPAVFEISRRKDPPMDLNRQLLDLGDDLWRNDDDVRARLEQTRDLRCRHGAPTDHEDATTDKIEKGREENTGHVHPPDTRPRLMSASITRFTLRSTGSQSTGTSTSAFRAVALAADCKRPSTSASRSVSAWMCKVASVGGGAGPLMACTSRLVGERRSLRALTN